MFLEKADGLDGFPEPHLVSEDDTVVLAPGVDDEVDALDLVVTQSTITIPVTPEKLQIRIQGLNYGLDIDKL